jgi:hypothetical protein
MTMPKKINFIGVQLRRHHIHLKGGSRLLAVGDTSSQRGVAHTPQEMGGSTEQTTEMPETGIKFVYSA